jgi:hypothetical protein
MREYECESTMVFLPHVIRSIVALVGRYDTLSFAAEPYREQVEVYTMQIKRSSKLMNVAASCGYGFSDLFEAINM